MFDTQQMYDEFFENSRNNYCIIQAVVDERNRKLLQKIVESSSLVLHFETSIQKLCERFN